MAVFELKTAGLSDAVARNLPQVLTAEVAEIDGTSVISTDDIASMLKLQEKKMLLGCLDDSACMAEIGGALGVDMLLVGQAGKLGASYVVSLRLVGVREVVVASRVTETFKGIEDQLLPAVRLAGRRLLGITDESPGAIVVTSNEQEAEVYIDEEKVGELPMPALRDLAPGRHAVRVRKEDFIDWRSDIYVEPGSTTPLWAEMVEAPVPWFRRWWVWTLVGVGVVAVTTTVVLGVTMGGEPPEETNIEPGMNDNAVRVVP